MQKHNARLTPLTRFNSVNYADALDGGAANDVWFDDERRIACLS